MTKIKVIYIDKTCGMVEKSRLNDLIAGGEIVAYCGSDGWSDVKKEKISGETGEQKRSDEKEVII